MISLDDAVIARLTSHGHHFEILVDPAKAIEAKEKELPLSEWVASDEVYKDSSKAEKASEEAEGGRRKREGEAGKAEEEGMHFDDQKVWTNSHRELEVAEEAKEDGREPLYRLHGRI